MTKNVIYSHKIVVIKNIIKNIVTKNSYIYTYIFFVVLLCITYIPKEISSGLAVYNYAYSDLLSLFLPNVEPSN